MALLTFPSNPTNGLLYPLTPAVGQQQYRYDASNNTWVLEGTGTGVVAGCYGDAFTVPAFCVDAVGRVTSVVEVPVGINVPDLQQVTDIGSITTNPIDVAGLIAAGLIYPLADGAATQVLSTDGAGALGWVDTLTVVAAPTTQTDFGLPNQVAYDAGYFYWFDGLLWQRVAAGPGGW